MSDGVATENGGECHVTGGTSSPTVRPRRRALCVGLAVSLGVVALAAPARAHEVRPAYLEITETTPGRYAVLWRTPIMAGMRLPVALRLPQGVRDVRAPTVQELTDSLVERRTIEAGERGLAGQRIEFVGLEATITDVLVRVAPSDGAGSSTLVRPARPWVEIAAVSGPLAVMRAYLTHGIEHILFGFDHLLFVLGLVLIVRSRRVLLWTVTAFTVAHSITLALATLGLVHLPGPPVEAAIALSILLLATEIVGFRRRGEIGLTARWPWVVAFAFGLLHGFGFASALVDVGLPRGDIPLALFAFNLGVECGQVAFVAAVLGVAAAAKRLRLAAPVERWALGAAPYAIGGLAGFWFIERLGRF
jgi:hydrogenase/urease accessory protein HupE